MDPIILVSLLTVSQFTYLTFQFPMEFSLCNPLGPGSVRTVPTIPTHSDIPDKVQGSGA